MEIAFYVDLIIHYILLVFTLYSIVQPENRIWPPVQKGWKYHLYWNLYYSALLLYLPILLQEYNTWNIGEAVRYFIGIPLIVLGGALMIWGVKVLSLKNTYGLKNGLVLQAPYTITRNPQYVGDIVMISGFLLFFNSYHLSILFLLAIITFIIMPFSEEIWLEEVYGERYVVYKAKTTRFL